MFSSTLNEPEKLATGRSSDVRDCMNLLRVVVQLRRPGFDHYPADRLCFSARKNSRTRQGMGQAVKEFQKAKDEFSDELHNAAQRHQAG